VRDAVIPIAVVRSLARYRHPERSEGSGPLAMDAGLRAVTQIPRALGMTSVNTATQICDVASNSLKSSMFIGATSPDLIHLVNMSLLNE